MFTETPHNRAGVISADRVHSADVENKKEIQWADGDRNWTYSEGEGFHRAGAFVELLDPRDGEAAVLTQVAGLREAGWFAEDMSSLVFEMIVFNGNVNKFLRIAFVVEVGSVGQSISRVDATTFDLSLLEFSRGRNVMRIVIEAVFIILFILFLKWEVEDFTDDTTRYLTRILSLLDVTTLCLNLVVIILEFSMVLHHEYWSFSFPLPPLYDTTGLLENFHILEHISFRSSTLQFCMSLSCCLMFTRAVVLLAGVSPSWGVLINSVARGKHYFVYFFIVFFMLLSGFAFSAHILFGTVAPDFTTLGRSFLTCFAMVLNGVYYNELVGADPFFRAGVLLRFPHPV